MRIKNVFEKGLSVEIELKRVRRVYYARPIPMMGTTEDKANIAAIRSQFPGAKLDYAKKWECGKGGKTKDMPSFFSRVDKAQVVVAAESKRGTLSSGVFSEAQHGRHADKKVMLIRRQALQPIKDLTLKNRNRDNTQWATVHLQSPTSRSRKRSTARR